MPLVDIRFVPQSKRYQWNKDVLETTYGDRYHWVQELGNTLYREALTSTFTEPKIELYKPKEGLEMLMDILEEHGHAAIFCACSNYERCHRAVVAKMAKDQYGVKIVHL